MLIETLTDTTRLSLGTVTQYALLPTDWLANLMSITTNGHCLLFRLLFVNAAHASISTAPSHLWMQSKSKFFNFLPYFSLTHLTLLSSLLHHRALFQNDTRDSVVSLPSRNSFSTPSTTSALLGNFEASIVTATSDGNYIMISNLFLSIFAWAGVCVEWPLGTCFHCQWIHRRDWCEWELLP